LQTPERARRLSDAPATLDEVLSGVTTIYTDLDGTLLGPGGGLFTLPDGSRSLDAARAVMNVCAAGVEVVPVSGRNKHQLLEDCRLLGLRHFVAEVGALVANDLMQVTVENLGGFPSAPAEDGSVRERIERTGAIQALFAAFPGRIEHHLPWTAYRGYSFILRGCVDAAQAQQTLERATDLPIVFLDNGIIRPKRHSLVGCDPIHAYHVLPAGVTKGSGVAVERRLRQVPRRAAIGIGDSASDVTIADEVELFFVVANGLADEQTVRAALDHDNVWFTDAPAGAGWAELADRIVRAKTGD
jgi:hydroxymethylpyrimidine pyrophosphatase-like HAD family hydrolase